MDHSRSSLFSYISKCLKKGADEENCAQLILRVCRNNAKMLNDGVFFIQTQGLPVLENSTFVRIKRWSLELLIDDLLINVREYEVIGVETMNDFNIRPLKSDFQIKALIISAFRKRLQAEITETPIVDILSLVNSITK
jgi:hypothetical protein